MEQERRVFQAPVEARIGGTDRERNLSGYAALYGTETRIAGLFREVLELGAFCAAPDRGDDVRALFSQANVVLGHSKAGTPRLTEDRRGLRYDAALPDTQAGRHLWTSVQRGDISQSSFAFTVDAEEWRDMSSEMPLRVVKSVRGEGSRRALGRKRADGARVDCEGRR